MECCGCRDAPPTSQSREASLPRLGARQMADQPLNISSFQAHLNCSEPSCLELQTTPRLTAHNWQLEKCYGQYQTSAIQLNTGQLPWAQFTAPHPARMAEVRGGLHLLQHLSLPESTSSCSFQGGCSVVDILHLTEQPSICFQITSTCKECERMQRSLLHGAADVSWHMNKDTSLPRVSRRDKEMRVRLACVWVLRLVLMLLQEAKINSGLKNLEIYFSWKWRC